MKSEKNRQRWREAIFQTYASEGIKKSKCAEIGNRFDHLTEEGGMSGENAAMIILDAYGSSDAKKVCHIISEWVNSELERFNASHIGINANARERLKRAISTLSNNIDKVSIIFNGQELTTQEIECIKPKLPIFCRSFSVHQASASAKSAGLIIDVII